MILWFWYKLSSISNSFLLDVMDENLIEEIELDEFERIIVNIDQEEQLSIQNEEEKCDVLIPSKVDEK